MFENISRYLVIRSSSDLKFVGIFDRAKQHFAINRTDTDGSNLIPDFRADLQFWYGLQKYTINTSLPSTAVRGECEGRLHADEAVCAGD